MTNQEILDYKCKFNDCNAKCLRDYFHELLTTLWVEGDGFSGKRPFGNSSWDGDIYSALVEMKAINGQFEYENSDGTGERYGLGNFDQQKANKLVPKLIKECIYGDAK